MTNNHDTDHQSRVMDYALNRLTPEEEHEFVIELGSDPAMQLELKEILDALSKISDSYAETLPAPRRELKAQIMRHILADGSKATPSPLVIHAALHSRDGWVESGLPGIELKPLFTNAALGTQTSLARLAPGTHYPKHRHVGTEECFVIEGDLHVNDITLTTGDYIVNQDGAIHHDTWTEGGCLVLITGSHADDFIV